MFFGIFPKCSITESACARSCLFLLALSKKLGISQALWNSRVRQTRNLQLPSSSSEKSTTHDFVRAEIRTLKFVPSSSSEKSTTHDFVRAEIRTLKFVPPSMKSMSLTRVCLRVEAQALRPQRACAGQLFAEPSYHVVYKRFRIC